ncbi:penicillin acylase family protein [Sphingomonas sp. MMS24-JH45]
MLRAAGGGAIVLLVLAAATLACGEPLSATRADPPPDRRYDSIIARDGFGVPHIFGRTDPDVAYGIAYAHAEDDFSTLQEVVAMSRGRLGALTGANGAKTDYVFHLLGARETVARDYDKQPADVRALLDGYASGLNRYAARHPGEVKLRRLFPIDGRDIATGFVLRSPFFFGLDQVIGALAGDKPLPPESAGSVPDAPYVTPLGVDERGSNAFAVAPKRSADGATRLISKHAPAVDRRGGVVRARGAFGPVGTSRARPFRACRIR